MDADTRKLFDVATDEEKLELTIFQNAVKKNLQAYHASPTKKNKQNLDAARASLEEKKEVMMKTHFEAEKHLPSFGSLRQVVTHLDNAGFKISKSKISRDKQKGLIKVNADGSVYETEVRGYAATLERKDGSVDDLNDVHARKTAREVESIELRIEKQKFELDLAMKKYLPRRDFEAELAARAAIFESGLKHWFTVKLPEIIAMVGGRSEKSPDLQDFLHHGLEQALSEYATTNTFQVMFFEQEDDHD